MFREFADPAGAGPLEDMDARLKVVLRSLEGAKDGRHELLQGARFLQAQLLSGELAGTRSEIHALAALAYLIEPFDVIPDMISGAGLLDDLYVVGTVVRSIERGHDLNHPMLLPAEKGPAVPDFVLSDLGQGQRALVNRLPPGAGQHLAARAKTHNVLNGYLRRALFSMGRTLFYGGSLSEKQQDFFARILEQLREQGLLDSPCEKETCVICPNVLMLVNG